MVLMILLMHYCPEMSHISLQVKIEQKTGGNLLAQPRDLQNQGTSSERRRLRTFWGAQKAAGGEHSSWHPFLRWTVWNRHRCELPACTLSHSNCRLPKQKKQCLCGVKVKQWFICDFISSIIQYWYRATECTLLNVTLKRQRCSLNSFCCKKTKLFQILV